MRNQILVPLDYSDVSQEVVSIADRWGQRINADLYFLHVDAEYMSNDDIDHNSFLERFEFYLQKFNIQSKHETHIRLGKAYSQVLEVADEIRPDLIIMAAHSHTMLGRLFLGSNTDHVLHHCQCPVYVHKQHAEPYANKVIVPIDETPINKPVIKFADAWAEETGAELLFIHTAPIPEYPGSQFAMESGFYHEGDEKPLEEHDQDIRDTERKKLDRTFKEFVNPLNLKSKHSFVFEFGKPYAKIKDLQEKSNAGLIMMAAHSHTLLDRLFVGSNTDFLMHHLNCPIYVYKEKPL